VNCCEKRSSSIYNHSLDRTAPVGVSLLGFSGAARLRAGFHLFASALALPRFAPLRGCRSPCYGVAVPLKLRLLQVLIGFPSLLPRYFCRRLLSATRIVVFAESEDAEVLGVDALEGLRLEVDPVTKQLRKVEALLAL